MSWSLGDRDYVSNGDKGGCSSDYFKYPGKFGQSVTCPDNVSATTTSHLPLRVTHRNLNIPEPDCGCVQSPWDSSNFTDHSNLLGMIDDLRYASAQHKASGKP